MQKEKWIEQKSEHAADQDRTNRQGLSEEQVRVRAKITSYFAVIPRTL